MFAVRSVVFVCQLKEQNLIRIKKWCPDGLEERENYHLEESSPRLSYQSGIEDKTIDKLTTLLPVYGRILQRFLLKQFISSAAYR